VKMAMAEKKVTSLNDTDFDTVIADGVTLVDCWAPWCAPCRVQEPILEEIALSIHGRVKIAKVDVDEAKDVAGRFGIQAIPTLLLFKDGNEVRRFIGVQPKEILIDAISSVL